MEIALTIIVPSYNMEKYLCKCLSSLIVPTPLMDSLEVLVVNDGSKDRTSEIAHSFANRWPSVFKVIDKVNGNYGSCINAALQEARGKYVKILDADDSFDNHNLSSFISLLDKENVDLVVSDFVFVGEKGDVRAQKRYDMLNGIHDMRQVPKAFSKEAQMQAVAYKRDIFKGFLYKQTEGISYTDQEWMFYPMSRVTSVSYYPVTIYRYLVGRDGQTINRTTMLRNRWMMLKITRRFVDWFAAQNINDTYASYNYLVNRLLSQLYIVYGICLLEPQKYDKCDDLILLDKDLSEKIPFLYEVTAGFVPANGIGFKFVSKYRETNYRDTSLGFRAYRILCRLKRCLTGR